MGGVVRRSVIYTEDGEQGAREDDARQQLVRRHVGDGEAAHLLPEHLQAEARVRVAVLVGRSRRHVPTHQLLDGHAVAGHVAREYGHAEDIQTHQLGKSLSLRPKAAAKMMFVNVIPDP